MHTLVILADEGLVSFDWASAVWILALFTILAVALYKGAWKHVLAGLKSREDRIRKDIADAEAARVKAEETLRQYDSKLAEAAQKVHSLLEQATADAEKLGSSLRLKAQQEAEEIKENATKEIEAAKRTALSEIYTQAADLATTLAEKIIRRNLNADDQRELVDQSLQQLQSAVRN